MIRIEPNKNNDATSSDEANTNWYEAEFAMNSIGISFKKDVIGFDRDEWKDAIYSEMKSLVENDTWKIIL